MVNQDVQPTVLNITQDFKMLDDGTYLIKNCKGNQKSIIIPEGVSVIGKAAFYSRKNLTHVVLPDSLKLIGKEAFCYTPLERVELAAHPVTINELAFTPYTYSRAGIKVKLSNTILFFRYSDVKIPLVLIDNWAITKDGKILADFLATEDMGRKQSLYSDVKKSEYKVFMAFYLAIVHDDYKCLQYIKRSKTKWSEDKIRLYADLIDYVLDKGKETGRQKVSEDIKNKDSLLSTWSFIDLPDGSYEIEKYKGKDTVIEIPDKFREKPVRSIGVSAFSMGKTKTFESIEKIVLPEGIREIADKAFEGCRNLTEVVLPDSLLKIGKAAFAGCSNLTGIVLPDSLAKIGASAFAETNISSMIIPEKVVELGDAVCKSCQRLSEVSLPYGLKSIPKDSFSFCSSLETITLPDSIESIEDFGFYDCNRLKKIGLPTDLKHIGCFAFNGCISLRTMTIPEGVTELGDNAFKNCENLSRIIIPTSVHNIGYDSFAYCDIVRVCAPEGSYAIEYCTKKRIPFDIYSNSREDNCISITEYSSYTLPKGAVRTDDKYSDDVFTELMTFVWKTNENYSRYTSFVWEDGVNDYFYNADERINNMAPDADIKYDSLEIDGMLVADYEIDENGRHLYVKQCYWIDESNSLCCVEIESTSEEEISRAKATIVGHGIPYEW